MTEEVETYLVWSHEHGAWWGPDRSGYTQRLSQAGRYSRTEASSICTDAMPGTSTQMGALPELPVRLADIELMKARYLALFGPRDERWL